MPVGPEAHRGGKLLTAAEKVGTWLCSLDRGRGKTQVAPHLETRAHAQWPLHHPPHQLPGGRGWAGPFPHSHSLRVS